MLCFFWRWNDMKIKVSTDYALRIIRLIYMEDTKVVTSKVISEKENISQGVIIKILGILKTNDIVESHQGRGENVGGFSLRANIEELTLYDILSVMEGPVNFEFARDADYYNKYGRKCNINKELHRLNHVLKMEMKKISLYEIFTCKEQEVEI